MSKVKNVTYILHCLCLFNLAMLVNANGLSKSMAMNNFCANQLNDITLSFTSHFAPDSLVHIVFPDDNLPSMLTPIMKHLFTRWQIVITQPNMFKQASDVLSAPSDVFIIFITRYECLDQLQNVINQLSIYGKSWNARTRFLLISTMKFSHSKPLNNQIVIDTFNFLWQRNVFKVAMVATPENCLENVLLFSSRPYSKLYNTCKMINSSAQLQEIDLTRNKVSTIKIGGYKFKTPKTFLGCALLGYTYPYPPYTVAEKKRDDTQFDLTYKSGIEINLVLFFAKLYNFSVKISTSNPSDYNGWAQLLPNGSSVGMLEDLVNYKIDLAFAGAIPTPHHYFNMDFTKTYIFNSMSWYVPDPDEISGWELIVDPFAGLTWLLLVITFIFFALLYYLMSSVKPFNEVAKHPLYLTMIGITLGVAPCRSPKLTHLKIMMITWSLFSLHVTIMYNTNLFSLFTHRPVNHGIRTIKELQESELDTCIASVHHDFYINKTKYSTRHFFENENFCSNIDNAVEELLEYRNFSLLGKDDYMSFLVDKKRMKVHTLEPNFVKYPVTMLLTKGSILIDPMNKIIQKAIEAGLIQKWLDNVRNEVKVKFTSEDMHNCDHTHIQLEKDDFFWLYKLLLCGQVIAFLVFILEFCYKNYSDT